MGVGAWVGEWVIVDGGRRDDNGGDDDCWLGEWCMLVSARSRVLLMVEVRLRVW